MNGDRIVLTGMRFTGRHGSIEAERQLPQTIEVDVELRLDLARAGRSDALEDTVDYGRVFETCREIVEGRTFKLLEAIAEALASAILSSAAVDEVAVRVRKLRVPVQGHLAHSAVEIVRARAGTSQAPDA